MKKYEQVKKFYNAEESAEFLGVHKPKFYEYLRAKSISPVMQLGRIKLYAISDLRALKRKMK